MPFTKKKVESYIYRSTDYFRRYRKPIVSISGFETPSVGYCISQEGTGVQVRCPLGLSLELTPLDGGVPEYPDGDFFKADENIWTRQSQYKCVGVDQRVLSPAQVSNIIKIQKIIHSSNRTIVNVQLVTK